MQAVSLGAGVRPYFRGEFIQPKTRRERYIPEGMPHPYTWVKPPTPTVPAPAKSVGAIQQAHYAGDIFTQSGIKLRAQRVAGLIGLMPVKPDFIALRGVSGLSIGYAAAMLVDILVVFCRKGESSHSHEPVHGQVYRAGTYVIVDDFVSSGETVREIHRMLCKCIGEESREPELLAVVTYERRYSESVRYGEERKAPTLGYEFYEDQDDEGLAHHMARYSK